MKKIYFDPEMEVIDLKIASAILMGSDDIPGGDDGSSAGSSTPPSDTSTPGWSEGL